MRRISSPTFCFKFTREAVNRDVLKVLRCVWERIGTLKFQVIVMNSMMNYYVCVIKIPLYGATFPESFNRTFNQLDNSQ